MGDEHEPPEDEFGPAAHGDVSPTRRDRIFSEWRGWVSAGRLRIVLAMVVLSGVATVLGMVALWPGGAGLREAQDSADRIGIASQRLLGTVHEVGYGPCSYSNDLNPRSCRSVTVRVDEGPDQGQVISLPEVEMEFVGDLPEVEPGQGIVLGFEPSTGYYFYADLDRRPVMIGLGVVFALFVVALGRWRGLSALAAMVTTLVVFVGFLAPSVLDGNDPLLVAVVTASAIAFLSLYLTHGLTPLTTVALAGTLSSLGLTLALSWIFFELAAFTGLAGEEAMVLPFIAGDIDVASLILGGAVIGALGAIDDVTVTQAALVAELHNRNPSMEARQLFSSGIAVGREHIASTINTLFLAYVGAGLPLLFLFAVSGQSLVMVANSELIAVELVRALCGSMGLVAAVPITTALASLVTVGYQAEGADQLD